MPLVVLLSLCSAIAYGASDFVGGVLTRKASVWAVAATSQATAALVALGLALVLGPNHVEAGAVTWAAAAGLGASAGNVFIYRGLAGGRMAVVAPISALVTAALPVVAGFATGERPGALAAIGVAAALPATYLVAGGGASSTRTRRADLVNGLAAGMGFGVQFSALGQIPQDAGLMPLAIGQFVSVGAIVAGAVALSQPWLPRDRHSALAVTAGLLAGAATVCFQLAAQIGLLTIAGVLASLYPAITVLLAAAILRERIHLAQGLGLALAALAVGLIAAG
jgi:drug/metabolite transporter (DMT)-like permease